MDKHTTNIQIRNTKSRVCINYLKARIFPSLTSHSDERLSGRVETS